MGNIKKTNNSQMFANTNVDRPLIIQCWTSKRKVTCCDVTKFEMMSAYTIHYITKYLLTGSWSTCVLFDPRTKLLLSDLWTCLPQFGPDTRYN